MATRFTGEARSGAIVALALDASAWWVIAYETELRGRDASLTRAHFNEIIRNFRRIGRSVPVALYHADRDPTAHPDARKAHAWLDDLRIGSMMLDGKKVATLEGKRRWVIDTTRADVACGAIVGGSITVFFDCEDDVTGENIGTLLYSFSLTNNPALTGLPALAASAFDVTNSPALVDLPRIAASRTLAASAWYGDLDDRDDVMEMLRCIFGLPALADEAAVTAELTKLAALLAAPDDASGIDADDIINQLRSAMRLPALTSAADVLAAIRAALAAPPGSAPVSYALGDRVRVKGTPHMPGQSTGVVAEVSGTAYGIVFDGMESMGTHRWYVADELVPAKQKTPPSAPGIAPEGHNDSTDSRSMSRGSRAAKEASMSTTMMALAARLGFAAPTEEAAAQHVAARAEESTEVRRSLGLPLAADAQAVAAKITALHSDAAKVAVLSAENEALKSVETERHNREVTEHVEALCADPKLASSRVALENFARNNFAEFSKHYPKPAVTAATLALTSRVTGLGGEKTPAIVAGRSAARHNDAARERATALMSANPALTLESALKQASRELRAGKGN